MSHNLIRVGNSNAVIIPAHIVKKHNFTSKTEFDIVEVSDGIKLIPKVRSLDEIQFPKAAIQSASEKVRNMRGAVKISSEEIEKDDRLKYILSR